MTKQIQEEQNTQKRQYWQTQMQSWQQSGMSQAGYCRSRNINLKTFSYWKRKFRQGGSAVKLIQIQPEKLLPGKDVDNRTTELKLIIDDRFAVEVREGFNPSTLRQVVETLRQL